MLWLPAERVLFAGDILLRMASPWWWMGLRRPAQDAGSHRLAEAKGVSPRRPADPGRALALTRMTREYITGLRDSMRAEVKRGTPMGRAVGALPPPDPRRPAALSSRIRRNAVRVYLEMERKMTWGLKMNRRLGGSAARRLGLRLGLMLVSIFGGASRAFAQSPRLVSTDSRGLAGAAGATGAAGCSRAVGELSAESSARRGGLNIETLRAGKARCRSSCCLRTTIPRCFDGSA